MAMAILLPSLLFFWYYKTRKQMLGALLGLILCIALVDNFIYRVLKPQFQRLRPPHVEKVIELRTERYAGYSFPSNHAGNNFAGATFLSSCYPALAPVFFSIAALVSYSRVYVGAHYPFDVLAGGVIGIIFGLFFFKIWKIILIYSHRRWSFLPLLTRTFVEGDKNANSDRNA